MSIIKEKITLKSRINIYYSFLENYSISKNKLNGLSNSILLKPIVR